MKDQMRCVWQRTGFSLPCLHRKFLIFKKELKCPIKALIQMTASCSKALSTWPQRSWEKQLQALTIAIKAESTEITRNAPLL